MPSVVPSRRSAFAPSAEQLSLITRVARLYHEQGMRQPQIAELLHLSQARVSRLLKEAVELRIVRTTVVPPPGVHSDLEEAVRTAYGIEDVHVVEAPGPEHVNAAIGSAGAVFLETTLARGDRVGVSSWSATVLAAVDAMSPRTVRPVDSVVQVIGGVGLPSVQAKATHLAEELGRRTGVVPTLFPAPGIVATASGREALLADPYIAGVTAVWSSLTVLLAGIGSLEPSPLLRDSGNAVSDDDQEVLRAAGAVGDVCLRFFDADGNLVDTPVNDRVLGIEAGTLLAIPRRVGLAGGAHKHRAIRAALCGGWVNVLITDIDTANSLLAGRP